MRPGAEHFIADNDEIRVTTSFFSSFRRRSRLSEGPEPNVLYTRKESIYSPSKQSLVQFAAIKPVVATAAIQSTFFSEMHSRGDKF